MIAALLVSEKFFFFLKKKKIKTRGRNFVLSAPTKENFVSFSFSSFLVCYLESCIIILLPGVLWSCGPRPIAPRPIVVTPPSPEKRESSTFVLVNFHHHHPTTIDILLIYSLFHRGGASNIAPSHSGPGQTNWTWAKAARETLTAHNLSSTGAVRHECEMPRSTTSSSPPPPISVSPKSNCRTWPGN